jgi:hypothetical protein
MAYKARRRSSWKNKRKRSFTSLWRTPKMEKEWRKLVNHLAFEVRKEIDKEILEHILKQINVP